MKVCEQKFPIKPVEYCDLSPQLAVTNSGAISVFDYMYGHGATIREVDTPHLREMVERSVSEQCLELRDCEHGVE